MVGKEHQFKPKAYIFFIFFEHFQLFEYLIESHEQVECSSINPLVYWTVLTFWYVALSTTYMPLT